MRIIRWLLLILFFYHQHSYAQTQELCITAYFSGDESLLDAYPIEKITHLIFSFGHLQGNQYYLTSAADSACIKKMVQYKSKYPSLKVILSLGGWSGCETCSDVFKLEENRHTFAVSVLQTLRYFKADGIDLDWEYPAISGYPGHHFSTDDRTSFTNMLTELRSVLGAGYEISFAAGGFDHFIDSSVDWKAIRHIVNKVYIMSYDLVHGYSTTSGHHTPLYATKEQVHSADHAIQRLIQCGVPPQKLVLGAACYARLFQLQDTLNHGLYRPCNFLRGISYHTLSDSNTVDRGFTKYWDPIAHAPYAFNPERKLLLTYDDSLSVTLKMNYVKRNKLGGIMFWQLADDRPQGGLLDAMFSEKKRKGRILRKF